MISISALQSIDFADAARVVKSPWSVAFGVLVAVVIIDPNNFSHIATSAIESLTATLPFIVVAVILIASMKATGSASLTMAAFRGRENKMIILAAFFGGLAPFCSCEVIPFVAALLATGAPVSAIMAFWLSSPLIDPPSLLITAAALDWNFALGKAVAAVGIGLLGGFCTKMLLRGAAFNNTLRANAVRNSCCGINENTVLWKFWQDSARSKEFGAEVVANGLFLLKWLALAYLIEALLVLYLPAEIIVSVVGGDGLWAIVIGALVGAPAYLNSYAAPALVAGLIDQGMSNGAGMAFMTAGAVSCIPAMVAVWSLVNNRVFAAYCCFGFIGAVLSGIAFSIVAG